MRIISKFRDFYDVVMKQGMDREVVYVREEKTVESKEDYGVDFTTKYSAGAYRTRLSYTADLIFLGYCGQIMRVVDLKYQVKNPNPTPMFTGPIEHRRVFFNYAEFEEFMIKNGYATDWDFDKGRKWGGTLGKFGTVETKKMHDIFHEFQVPLFALRYQTSYLQGDKTMIDLGPRLKDLDFHKFKDPYSTYQDIFQFVAGTLNKTEKEMVKISDKDKIHKHGFDKWSFRKMPTKKK